MTHSLGGDSLEKRRYIDSVTLMFKVVHNLVLLPLIQSSLHILELMQIILISLCIYLQIQMLTSILFSQG